MKFKEMIDTMKMMKELTKIFKDFGMTHNLKDFNDTLKEMESKDLSTKKIKVNKPVDK